MRRVREKFECCFCFSIQLLLLAAQRTNEQSHRHRRKRYGGRGTERERKERGMAEGERKEKCLRQVPGSFFGTLKDVEKAEIGVNYPHNLNLLVYILGCSKIMCTRRPEYADIFSDRNSDKSAQL